MAAQLLRTVECFRLERCLGTIIVHTLRQLVRPPPPHGRDTPRWPTKYRPVFVIFWHAFEIPPIP